MGEALNHEFVIMGSNSGGQVLSSCRHCRTWRLHEDGYSPLPEPCPERPQPPLVPEPSPLSGDAFQLLVAELKEVTPERNWVIASRIRDLIVDEIEKARGRE